MCLEHDDDDDDEKTKPYFQKYMLKDIKIGCIHRLIDLEVFLQLRCNLPNVRLIHNSNGE